MKLFSVMSRLALSCHLQYGIIHNFDVQSKDYIMITHLGPLNIQNHKGMLSMMIMVHLIMVQP